MHNDNYIMVAKTFQGLEGVLADELRELGAEDVVLLNRAVSFRGNLKFMYRANYCLRTAIRILKPFAEFRIYNEEDLYVGIRSLEWFNWLKTEGTFAVDAVLYQAPLNHSRYVEQKVKDAIVDLYRDKFARRPSVDLNEPQLRINVYINRNNCSVSLDSSGTSLHKRGWRVRSHEATINEILAAGMLKLSGWKGDSPLLDPMCGSGTILIEAAMMAMNLPAGFYRPRYGFQTWPDYNRKLWEDVKEQEIARQTDPECEILGCDKSPKSIEMAEDNLRHAKLHRDVELKLADFETLEKPFETGTIITNPPYDERIKVENVNAFYETLGSTLKHRFSGYNAWVISSGLEALKHVGLKSAKKFILMNGPLECRFLGYELFSGKHSDFKKP